MQTQFFAAARGQCAQIWIRRPALIPSQSVFLGFVAEIPDLMTRPRQGRQFGGAGGILDAVLKGLNHGVLAVEIIINIIYPMNENNNIRRGRHCVFNLHVHLVFVAKYRCKVFDSDAIERLRAMFGRVCESFEARLVEVDGERDHVHLLVEYPPKVSISSLVNRLKGASSQRLRRERPDLAARYWKGVLWSPSYFAASCGGAPISVIRQYIEQQQTPTA